MEEPEFYERLYSIVAVDFDGTLCADNFPNIGDANEELINILKNFKDKGNFLILWTCRNGSLLQEAVEWCISKGLFFDTVNENISGLKNFNYDLESRKIFADIYIDDRSVHPMDLGRGIL